MVTRLYQLFKFSSFVFVKIDMSLLTHAQSMGLYENIAYVLFANSNLTEH